MEPEINTHPYQNTSNSLWNSLMSMAKMAEQNSRYFPTFLVHLDHQVNRMFDQIERELSASDS